MANGRLMIGGHTNIRKRLPIHAGGFNLGLVMRQLIGLGTPRGLPGPPRGRHRCAIRAHGHHPTPRRDLDVGSTHRGHGRPARITDHADRQLVSDGDLYRGLLMDLARMWGSFTPALKRPYQLVGSRRAVDSCVADGEYDPHRIERNAPCETDYDW